PTKPSSRSCPTTTAAAFRSDVPSSAPTAASMIRRQCGRGFRARLKHSCSSARHDVAKTRRAAKRTQRWSQKVTEHSDALDLQRGVFTLRSPRSIAQSLKRSAEHSRRRKSAPYRSAMSMLTFYLNRAGRHLPPSRRKVLNEAKDELRRLFAGRRGAK